MKYLFLFMLTILISNELLSLNQEPIQVPYSRVHSQFDSTLAKNEAIIKIQFSQIKEDTFTILHSIDGVDSKTKMKKGDNLYFKTTPGKHTFQFFYNGNFNEMYANIYVKEQYSDLWDVYFTKPVSIQPIPDFDKPIQVQPLKPVIYLYPQKEQKVFVNVKPVGEFTLTYPEIKNGWNVHAKPNGELSIDGEQYNYLFWESNQDYKVSYNKIQEGSVIKGDNTISFLEDALSRAGLNSKEKADFITFWAPRMMHNKYNFIHFEFNDDCNNYARLSIKPKPDNLYRLFMTWTPVSYKINIKQQDIVPVNRTGFTVIEWGGARIPWMEKCQAQINPK